MCVVSGTQKPQDKWLTAVPITTPKCTLTAGSPRAHGISALLTTPSALNINRPGAAHPFPLPLSYTNLPFLPPALLALLVHLLLSCPCPFSSYLTPPPTTPLSFSGPVPSLIATIKSFFSVIPCGHVLITFMWQRQCFACLVMDINSWHDVSARFPSL